MKGFIVRLNIQRQATGVVYANSKIEAREMAMYLRNVEQLETEEEQITDATVEGEA